ncbi:MAG TPA: hypothetical protein VND93_09480 [Myxococcales bacterium]|nr:hypothetical protein [Myxococcales bacterium]
MSASLQRARRKPTFLSAALGVASMAASLGAVAFLLTSDVAVAEPRPEPAPAAVQAQGTQQAQVQAKVEKPAPRAKPRRKRIDLGRFEGY